MVEIKGTARTLVLSNHRVSEEQCRSQDGWSGLDSGLAVGEKVRGLDAERCWGPVDHYASSMGRHQRVLMREAASLHFEFKRLTLLLF